MNKKMNKKGFTIVELVIVIAVIAILAAVIVPTFSTVVTKANESKALQEAKNAYTESLVKVLADGVIDEATDTVTFGGTEYTFTYTNGALTGVSGKAGYTYRVANGTITEVTKNSNS